MLLCFPYRTGTGHSLTLLKIILRSLKTPWWGLERHYLIISKSLNPRRTKILTTSNDFVSYLFIKNQALRFIGYGEACHNYVWERSINTIVCTAQNLLVFVALISLFGTAIIIFGFWKWVMISDSIIVLSDEDTGISHQDMWNRYMSILLPFYWFNVCVCTSYVLETKLQKSGVNIPKWIPRYRGLTFMGLWHR